MNSEQNQHGTWIQRIWWCIRDLYQQLKPCRFSLLVALIACPVFLCVAQGTEILRTVGEGMAGGQAYWPRAIGFFAALILWAICSWYAARVLLCFDFRGPHRVVRSEFAETHAPRILGIAPILIVGGGFFVASQSYDTGTSPWRWLIGFAVFCALLAFVFICCSLHAGDGLAPGRHAATVKRVRDLSGSTFAGLGIIALISLGLFLGSTIAPVRFAQFIGMGTILLLGRLFLGRARQLLRFPRSSLAVSGDHHLCRVSSSFQPLERQSRHPGSPRPGGETRKRVKSVSNLVRGRGNKSRGWHDASALHRGHGRRRDSGRVLDGYPSG